MTYPFDSRLIEEFERYCDNDEQILWAAKPRFLPYAITGLGPVILSLAFAAIAYYSFKNFKQDDGSTFHIPGFFFLFVIGIPVGQYLLRLLSFQNVRYAFTNKHIMLRSGFMDTDMKCISYAQIIEMSLHANPVDRLFSTGTIRFFSGRTETDEGNTKKLYERWESIATPEEIFRMTKELWGK